MRLFCTDTENRKLMVQTAERKKEYGVTDLPHCRYSTSRGCIWHCRREGGQGHSGHYYRLGRRLCR